MGSAAKVLRKQTLEGGSVGKVLRDLEEDRDPVVQKSVGLHQSTWDQIDEAIARVRRRNGDKKPVKLNKVIERLILYALKEDAQSEMEETKGGRR